MDDLLLPPKDEVFSLLLREGTVLVHLDTRRPGVMLPVGLLGQNHIILELGYDMAIPIPDLSVDRDGLQATLSFQRQPFHCSIPWSAVFGMTLHDGRGLLFPTDVPEELRSRLHVLGDGQPDAPQVAGEARGDAGDGDGSDPGPPATARALAPAPARAPRARRARDQPRPLREVSATPARPDPLADSRQERPPDRREGRGSPAPEDDSDLPAPLLAAGGGRRARRPARAERADRPERPDQPPPAASPRGGFQVLDGGVSSRERSSEERPRPTHLKLVK